MGRSAAARARAADLMEDIEPADQSTGQIPGASLTIAEAKRRLALTFGVDPSSVRITIEA